MRPHTWICTNRRRKAAERKRRSRMFYLLRREYRRTRRWMRPYLEAAGVTPIPGRMAIIPLGGGTHGALFEATHALADVAPDDYIFHGTKRD